MLQEPLMTQTKTLHRKRFSLSWRELGKIHVGAGFCFWTWNWSKGDSGFISWFDQRAETVSLCHALVRISEAVWVLVGTVVTMFEEAEFQRAVWVIILLFLHHCIFSTGVRFVAVIWWIKSVHSDRKNMKLRGWWAWKILMPQNIHTDFTFLVCKGLYSKSGLASVVRVPVKQAGVMVRIQFIAQ